MRQMLDNNDIDVNSIDYDYAKNTFYLTDDKNNKIYKGIYDRIGSTLRIHPIVTSNLLGPLSIAVDWVNDKLYVAEKPTSRIDVFTTDGLQRTNLITTNIFSPTSLALDPIESYLFFTDAGGFTKLQKPKIERAFMDGTSRTIIVSEKLLEPVAIALDILKKRVYWLDKKYDHIETCDYYGLKRHVIASGSQFFPHSITLDIFENTIYYGDATKQAILKFRRHSYTTDANITTFYKFNDFTRPKAVKVFHETKQLSRNNPCTSSNSSCEHFCLLSHSDNPLGAYRCKCRLGFKQRRDLKSCEPVSEYIYFSQGNTIRAVPLETSFTESRVPILLQRGAARAIEADCINNRTFYFDGVRRAIFQTKFEGDEPKPLVPNNLFSVEGLAYDWISKNLYFTDMNRVTVIQVENPNTRRDIIVQQGRLFEIVVDPNVGYIFFANVQRPAKIYRAYLDGMNLTAIVQRELSMPQSITLDYQTKKIYWADSHLGKIQYSDYNGRNIVTLSTVSTINPTSIFIQGFSLYYIDNRISTIYKTTKYYAAFPMPLRSNINNLLKLKVFSRQLQGSIDNHPCTRQNGDCNQFCFAAPSADPQYPISRHCGCSYGQKLDTNSMTCIVNPEEPLVNNCNYSFLFRCANDRCVRYNHWTAIFDKYFINNIFYFIILDDLMFVMAVRSFMNSID